MAGPGDGILNLGLGRWNRCCWIPPFQTSSLTAIAKSYTSKWKGRLELTDVRFQDNDHLLKIIRLDSQQCGPCRDESVPMVDAAAGWLPG